MPYGFWPARLSYVGSITCVTFEMVYSVGVGIVRFL